MSAPFRYDELVAARLGINRTDLRCLDLLHETGTMSAGPLAVGSGLTTGATTRMLDRLERIGYIRRLPDREDRRRVARKRAVRLLRGRRPARVAARLPGGGRKLYERQAALLEATRSGRKARTSCSAIRFSGIPRFAIPLSDAGHYLPHASASSQVWR